MSRLITVFACLLAFSSFSQDEIAGCTISFACNYNPLAVVDDGNCDFISCLALGCTLQGACNYDPDAVYDDGTCYYIEYGDCDCDGNTIDECGVCGGGGIPEGDCDCEGNQDNVCGECGGDELIIYF